MTVGMNVAVALRSAFMVTEQLAGAVALEQSLPHAENVMPEPGVPVRVTGVPLGKVAEQVPEEHEIPAGELVMVPDPAPRS
jgi:hypothetical protein